MKKSLYLPLIGALIASSSCLVGCKKDTYGLEDISNANGSAYYEIFVHEYADSNGDGIGDLNGLSNKLSYLKKLGVGGVWLMPIMPSNTYHKYDCKDYKNIDPQYGTIEDFDNMIKSAKENNIDVIIDLVLNHTSTSHPWFIQSEKDYRDNYSGDDSKKDWYVWKSVAGTGYAKSSVANAYYECNFDSKMPELNMDNEQVRNAIKDIAKFWLEKGVKGFRLDAAKYYYYEATSKNVEFLKWFKEECEKIREDVYLVGEVYTTSSSTILEYAESGISFFNFPMSENTYSGWAKTANSSNAASLSNSMMNYYSRLEERSATSEDAPFISNHDMDRSAGYLQNEKAKLAASNYLLAKGHPFIYYGEEIGLRGKRPANSATDADRRLAMIWNEKNDTSRCDDPKEATYNSNGGIQVTKGALDNIDDKDTLTYTYRKILSIRNKYNDFFQKGNYESLGNDNVLILKITRGEEVIYRVTNMGEEKVKISLPNSGLSIADEIRITNYVPNLSNTTLDIGAFNTVILK